MFYLLFFSQMKSLCGPFGNVYTCVLMLVKFRSRKISLVIVQLATTLFPMFLRKSAVSHKILVCLWFLWESGYLSDKLIHPT